MQLKLSAIKCGNKHANMDILVSSPAGNTGIQPALIHQGISEILHTVDWLSMVLRLHQHNIGYMADSFYRSDDPTNSVKALNEGG